MEPRLIIQFRLSKRWTYGTQEPAQMLAIYLYALYTFTGLADPSAHWGWTIDEDHETGIPHLFIYEKSTVQTGDKGLEDLEDFNNSDQDDFDFGLEFGPEEDDHLGEEDLNPDL
ncbi:MAG: hypothetical protein Q8P12_05155 [bacterium]|nr:hypothetical protein [bacterium]